MTEPSDALMELGLAALDHGIDSIRGGGPLVPFLMVEEGGERALHRFAAETLEESLEQAQRAAAALPAGATAYAITHDGFLTVEGQRTDAILVEAGERGVGRAIILAQRYRPKKALKRFGVIGNAALVGDTGNRL